MLRTSYWLLQTRHGVSLQLKLEGIALGIKSNRPADYCGVPGGDHTVRAALSQAAADDARLLSRRPQHSMVGDFAIDCGGGDQHAHHHQHSGTCLRFEFYFFAT